MSTIQCKDWASRPPTVLTNGWPMMRFGCVKRFYPEHLITLILWAVVFAAFGSPGQGWTSRRWDECVVVEALKDELPTSELDITHFLWSHVFSKPELDGLGNITTTARWKEWLPLFEQGLIQKAQKQSLDAESLRRCLIVVSNQTEKIAYLPVGAYATKQGDMPVWIVALKWEYSGSKTNYPPLALTHTRAFAFDARKRSMIGFTTCN
jgi:hypothetical protein